MSKAYFIDTNVWFSAFYGSPNAERLIQAHIHNQIQATISQQVLDELIKNISQKIPSQLPHLQTLLQAAPPTILKNPTSIPSKLTPPTSSEDTPLIAAAIQANIPYFITDNTKDFNISQIQAHFPITILTPKQAITQIQSK